MKEDLKTFLKEVSLFSGLSDDELDVLAEVATEVEYPRNSQIVRQGDPGGSLLIVSSGEVKIVLQRPAGEEVRLSTFRRGDFFGELSLFDGKPRSATALAVVDSRIVEIGGKGVLSQIAKAPQVALKILAEIASRVRRTDETVKELADKVYQEAYSAVQASVAAQLDSIKTIYLKTEERASQTLARAAQTVDIVEKAWSLLSRTVPAAGIGLTFLVIALGLLGVKSYQDIMAKQKEVNDWHANVKSIHEEMQSRAKNLKVIEETMIDLRDIREAVRLGRPIDTPDDLTRAALHYDWAKRKVLEKYIRNSQYERYEPEVALEAIDTFLGLERMALQDGRFLFDSQATTKERQATTRDLFGALLFVLNGLPGSADSGWLEEFRLRQMFRLVREGTEPSDQKETIESLKQIVRESRDIRKRQNAALILADFEQHTDQAVAVLTSMMDEEKKNPWKSAMAAISLARLKVVSGWWHITQQLDSGDPKRAHPAAVLLAQEERSGLERLAARIGPVGALEQLMRGVKRVLGRSQLETRNCLKQRYDRLLVERLDMARPVGPLDKPGDGATARVVGGKCTVAGQA